MASTVDIVAVFERHLAPILGPHTARVAVRTFSKRSLGCEPSELRLGDVSALCAALEPMLRTFVGAEGASRVVSLIDKELAP